MALRLQGLSRPPAALLLGIVDRALSAKEILGRRLFPWREERLQGWLRDCYHGRIPTRVLPRVREHRRKLAS